MTIKQLKGNHTRFRSDVLTDVPATFNLKYWLLVYITVDVSIMIDTSKLAWTVSDVQLFRLGLTASLLPVTLHLFVEHLSLFTPGHNNVSSKLWPAPWWQTSRVTDLYFSTLNTSTLQQHHKMIPKKTFKERRKNLIKIQIYDPLTV